jgi:diguanylate cyclase (GGDEF)-like protein/PAS domain S-box-containing protein
MDVSQAKGCRVLAQWDHLQLDISAQEFRRKFRLLILSAWTFPPIVGLSFLIFIDMFSLEQMSVILTTPLQPTFIIISLLLAFWYLDKKCHVVYQYLNNDEHDTGKVLKAISRYPLHFWLLFLGYLLLAPATVILSAEIYTDYQPGSMDWFRIHLVALIVSIIVGLPIFFLMMDLFGQAIRNIHIQKPTLTISLKVFLIGALVPLLIDTMIVQYYWARTQYFTGETFVVWAVLEILAIIGSLLFAQSFAQSLRPLGSLSMVSGSHDSIELQNLRPQSTDELGVISSSYRQLLTELRSQHEILQLTNSILSKPSSDDAVATIISDIFNICRWLSPCDRQFLMLYDKNKNSLVCVATTTQEFREEGYFDIELDETSMAAWVFKEDKTLSISELENDQRVKPQILEQYGVRSAIATPLRVEDEAIGVMISATSEFVHKYTPREINSFETLARDAALAIHTYLLSKEKRVQKKELDKLYNYNQLLLESASEGILGVGLDLKITFSNKAAEEFLKYNQELEGLDIINIFQHRHEKLVKNKLEQLEVYKSITEGKRFVNDNGVFWCQDNSVIPVHYSINPLIENDQISGAVIIFRDISEAKKAAQKMDFLASHDSLTGLINRREFESRLGSLIESASYLKQTHILCYLDLDQFKIVNDTCGHVAGDELLRQLTMILKKLIRINDTLARLGGDEFGVILENCGLDKATEIAEEFRKSVQEFRFSWDGKSFSIGVSIGIVELNELTEDVTDALSAADSACYMAKDMGRNRIHVYQRDDKEIAKRQGEMQWITKLQHAYENDNFELCAQNIEPASPTGREKLHLEVLIRMQSKARGMIMPGSFMPAAERYNYASYLDRWVIVNCLKWLQENESVQEKISLISINLSGMSVGDVLFAEYLRNEIAASNVNPEILCFEITETAAVTNLSNAISLIKELKAMGCKFALDDFGSGMSSFVYLKNLPVDFLKIDGNFVVNVDKNEVDRTMVEVINQLGHVMGIKTIAEYVESDDIRTCLTEIGVDMVQGYAISKPYKLSNLA